MNTVPESVIRAIAAAPQSHVRDLVLAALGLDSEFNKIPEEERQAAIDELAEIVGEKPEPQLEELPF